MVHHELTRGDAVPRQDCNISSATGSGIGVEGGQVAVSNCTISLCKSHGLALFPPIDGACDIPVDPPLSVDYRIEDQKTSPLLEVRADMPLHEGRPTAALGRSEDSAVEHHVFHLPSSYRFFHQIQPPASLQDGLMSDTGHVTQQYVSDVSLVADTGHATLQYLSGPGCTVRVKHCMIADNAGDGLLARDGIGLDLHDNTITSNGGWGLNVDAEVVSASGNTVMTNGKGALRSGGVCPPALVGAGTGGTNSIIKANGNRLQGKVDCR